MSQPIPATSPIDVDDGTSGGARLRVAVVTETYPPEVNGVALTLARLVSGLRERQHDVQLVRPRQDPARGSAAPDAGVAAADVAADAAADAAGESTSFHEVLLRGWPVPRYPGLKMGLPSKAALVSLWSRRRPDLVHVATEGPLGWSALEAARRLKLPTTSDYRTQFHVYCRHYGLGWLARPMLAYLRKFHNRAGCTMVPTESLRRELTELGFERLLVVPRGVDTRRFDPRHRRDALRRAWGVGPADPVLLSVGRLAPEKNLMLLARTFSAVRAAQPLAKLVVVGDGPSRRELEALLPDAHFAGTRLGDDLAAHYASADVFVFPSLTETYGNVVAEALASGLAVLAFDHAAAGQLIRDGLDGVLVAPGDDAAFVARALELVEGAEHRAELGEAARRTSLAIGWDRVVAQVESVMRDAVRRGAVGAPAKARWDGVPSL